MKILLAIDGSGFSQAALQMVGAQTRTKITRVRVLHVINFRETPLANASALTKEQKEELRKVRASIAGIAKKLNAAGFTVETLVLEDPVRQEELRKARKLVEQAARRLRTRGLKVDAVVEVGDTGRCIVDTAAEWHADLIVVGSKGLRGLKRFMLGSVSDFVARNAPCSVEIVRLPMNHKK